MTSHDITALLRAWSQGDQGALESLVPLVDPELRRVARWRLVCAPQPADWSVAKAWRELGGAEAS